jgi:hypothetical protein
VNYVEIIGAPSDHYVDLMCAYGSTHLNLRKMLEPGWLDGEETEEDKESQHNAMIEAIVCRSWGLW